MADGHGGPRQGRPGVAYPQRTDLMEQPRTTGGGGAPPQQPPRQGAVRPDDVPNLADPSADSRPVTDGLPIGPGAGPGAMIPGPGLDQDKTMLTLQELYRATGSPFLLRLMNQAAGMRRLAR